MVVTNGRPSSEETALTGAAPRPKPRVRFAFAILAAATAVALSTLRTVSAPAAEGDRVDARFEIYGFAMVDWIQDSKRVDPAWQDAFRPSKIAAPEGQFGSNGQSSISVKQSYFEPR